MMKKIGVASVLAGLSLGASAADSVLLQTNQGKDDRIGVELALGRLQGVAKEYVYSSRTGQQLSQLDWRTSNLPIVKAAISWPVASWLTLDARGWTAINSGRANMNDYDWEVAGQSHWSEWSYSPNTKVNSAHEIDVSATGWLLQLPAYKAGVVAGYQVTRFSWTATGGHYEYNNGADIGDFDPNVPGISYRQKYSFPYVGIAGQYRRGDWEFNSLVKFSPWVKAEDFDIHHNTRTSFSEKANGARYYGINLDAGYYVTPAARLFAQVSWNKFFEVKANGTETDMDDNTTVNHGANSAGLENKSYVISLGLQYRF